MSDSIDLWIAVGFVIAFFIGLFIRYLMDYCDWKFGRKAPRYEDSKEVNGYSLYQCPYP